VRILVLGGDGMLGHQLLKHFSAKHELRVTLRQDRSAYTEYGLFDDANAYTGIDIRSLARLSEVFADFRPEAVINAVGIVKQRQSAKDVVASLEINALLPHRLATLSRACNARFVHMSTDCVFDGARGAYTEDDVSNAQDIYGRTKYLGEVHDVGCITLRTSIIGLELSRKASLVEWFLAQQGKISGYDRAIYSGLTTQEMARIIEHVLSDETGLHGLWHVASKPISKYQLLRRVADRIGKTDIEIERDESFVLDRSLDASRFNTRMGYEAPEWDRMLDELAADIQRRQG